MNGIIEGGWEYVYAAYAVVMGGLTVYGVTLVLRLRDAHTLLEKHKTSESARASAVRRAMNFLIDQLCIGLFILAIIRFTSIGTQIFTLSVTGLLVHLLYYIAFEMLLGRTPGKFITGTMVTNLEGNKASARKIVSRTLLRLIPLEPLSFLISKNGWHDHFSGTHVVYKTSENTQPTTLPDPLKG